MTRTRFGVLLPGIHPDLAARAERVGLDSVWVSEHILFHVPLHDGLSVIAAYAARTETVQVGTAVMLLALRHPTPVAKAVATIDVLSKGRVVLGVGVGGEYPKEFEACGIPVNERGRRVDESIEVMRRLWTESHVSHKGRFFSFEDATMEPKPMQPGGPPIWIGGRSDAAIRRAGRIGNGYLPYLVTPQRFTESFGKVQSAASEAGRDASKIEPALYLFAALDRTREVARAFAVEELSTRYNQSFEAIVDKYCALGPAAACAATIGQFIEAGVRHVILVPLCPDSRLGEDIDMIGSDVIPSLRGLAARS